VLKIPKETGNSPQQITVEGRQFTIPAHTHVFPNIFGLHNNSEYWGADAHVWRPDRWTGYTSSKSKSLDDETVKTPVKGSYVPWAEGPRICPGKKFSQVEYVAVIARLLRNHKIEVVKNSTETDQQARQRVISQIQNSDVKITLQMRSPESVQLRFVRREI
jgi:cytochrome P450